MPSRSLLVSEHSLPESPLQQKRRMKRVGAVLLAAAIATTAVFIPNEVFAKEGPILGGMTDLPECRDALKIADAIFRSDAPYLYYPPAVPTGVPSELVLGPSDLDISGGDALTADPSTFDKQPKTGNFSHRSVYWQKVSQAGYRLVVDETPHGWRGDQYAVFAVPEATKSDDFIAQVSGGDPRNQNKIRPIVEHSWRPPLAFRGESGRLWLIDVGQPYEFLGAWAVYVSDAQGPRMSCSIDFRPKSVRTAIALLPPQVRALAGLLDKTIGSGEGEGTMQQTARMRLELQHAWANAALRPWALGSSQPYHSREDVDASLADWARKESYNHELLGQIRKQYRLAEPSMAAYYQGRFGRSKPESKRMAAYALDIMFRSHYVFHRERHDAPDEPPANPWRTGQSALNHPSVFRVGPAGR
jgi:hypothetical protein